jgi:hypothetical protein
MRHPRLPQSGGRVTASQPFHKYYIILPVLPSIRSPSFARKESGGAILAEKLSSMPFHPILQGAFSACPMDFSPKNYFEVPSSCTKPSPGVY